MCNRFLWLPPLFACATVALGLFPKSAAAADMKVPVTFGGGHETAWGTFQGVMATEPNVDVGVINFDAHLDLRGDEPGNSGTPFNQMAKWCEANDHTLLELAIGWLAAQPSVGSVIAGASTPAQLRANVDAVGWRPDESELRAIDNVLGVC